MSLQLNEKEKRAVAAAVIDRIEEHLNRFPYSRYPTEPLEEWRRVFCDPNIVPFETVRLALGWHFGGWQRKDLPLSHRKTIDEVSKAWPELANVAVSGAEHQFTFWQEKLTDWQHGFGVAAFLLYLQQPDTFEIVDRHRLDAMFELLKAIGHPEKDRPTELSFTALQDYTSFYRAVFPKLPYGNDSRIKLDRFLKAYGNRHAYKLVSPDFRTREATIRTFSWDTAASKQFRLDQISHRSNADLLFACFLLSLEAENRSHEDLTIGEVIDRLPLGTGGICNQASFNYALVALFGGQKQRDYWVYRNPELRHAFTEQANQSTRNMRYYLSHASEKLSVNPKYVKESEHHGS